MIKYPETKRFEKEIKSIILAIQYVGKDDAGKAIYDYMKPLPTITLKGTVKVHGMNAGIGFDGENLWFQSRQDVLSLGRDVHGFCNWGEKNKSEILPMMKSLFEKAGSVGQIVLYGEWAGTGIQKGVGVSKVPKFFMVFGLTLPCDSEQIKIKIHSLEKELHYSEFPEDEFKTGTNRFKEIFELTEKGKLKWIDYNGSHFETIYFGNPLILDSDWLITTNGWKDQLSYSQNNLLINKIYKSELTEVG